MSKWIDQPDGEGWWWHESRPGLKPYPYLVYRDAQGDLRADLEAACTNPDCASMGGRWARAVPPPFDPPKHDPAAKLAKLIAACEEYLHDEHGCWRTPEVILPQAAAELKAAILEAADGTQAEPR